LKWALDATVAKQGVFDLVFHPHGWIRAEQINELIDHAVNNYGKRVKFLTFREALERLNKNLLAGQTLRDASGLDHGVRIVDLNRDGYLEAVVGNGELRQTRIWSPADKLWTTTDFPVELVAKVSDGAQRETGCRFGIGPEGRVWLLARDESRGGCWEFDG